MADGLIKSLNDLMTYYSLIGQYTECKIDGKSKSLKISGIYDFGKPNPNYDDIKESTNED
jgi:hypothetical protein